MADEQPPPAAKPVELANARLPQEALRPLRALNGRLPQDDLNAVLNPLRKPTTAAKPTSIRGTAPSEPGDKSRPAANAESVQKKTE
jgi:hypothetical protein